MKQKKISYITNIESCILIQEEINSITNLFTWCFFELIISFMLSGDYFLSKSGVIRLILLMNACLCTEYFFLVEEMNLIFYLIYVLLANDLFGIDLVQSEVCDYLF